MICSIYAITCTANGKVYVGSSVDTNKRWNTHKAALRRGEHENPRLQADWSRYGAGAFEFSVVQEASPDKLLEQELFWLKRLHCFDSTFGYNISKDPKDKGQMRRAMEARYDGPSFVADPIYDEAALIKIREQRKVEAHAMQDYRNRIVGLEWFDPSELRDHPKNWRGHTGEQRDALDAVMNKVGISGAGVAYKSDRFNGMPTLIDGHLRKDMITDKVPVIMLDVNDDEADVLLATFDPIGAMAQRDEDAHNKLLEEVAERDTDGEMDQLLRAMGRQDALEALEKTKVESKPEYPIEPNFDESYNFVAIFCKTDREWISVTQRLKLQKRLSKGKPYTSHVLTGPEFCKAWDSRLGADQGPSDDNRGQETEPPKPNETAEAAPA